MQKARGYRDNMKILSTKRFEELLQEINNLEKEVSLERTAKHKSQSLLSESLKKIKSLEESLDNCKAKLITQKVKYHKTSSKLGGYVTSCNSLKNQLNSSQEQYNQIKIENMQLAKSIEKIKDDISVQEARTILDNQLIESLKRKLANYEKRLANYREEIKKYHVQKSINEYDKRLKSFSKKGG